MLFSGSNRARHRRVRRVCLPVIVTLAFAMLVPIGTAGAVTDPCGAGANPVACENSKPGTPFDDWYTPNAWGDIAGFSTAISVDPGGTLQLKVSSPVAYQVEIYRLGWYGGDGARLMPTSPTTTYPAKTQPACDKDTSVGLVDCGNWSTTVTWQVPSDLVSGVYLADLDQTDSNGVMPVPFIVRNTSSHSDVVVQTSDETWQAYNQWAPGGFFAGANLYQGNGPAPDGRAYKVSYNRPTDVGGDNGLFGSEYAMISWLERNGYDVSYLSGVDVTTQGSLLLNHKVFMSSGHDEYWNQAQWDNVTAAKKAGVNLAFFSGNEVFWRTRFEPSIDGSNTANRTLVCYKMTKLEFSPPDGVPDPSGQWTGTWMDPVGAGYGGGEPQNQLTGTLFQVNGYRSDAMTVSSQFSKMRLWRNTSIASLAPGQMATFPTGTLGYEWDTDANNGFRPPGEIDLSSTTLNITDGTYRLDNGNNYGNGTATHNLVEYRDPTSHALVFGSGTVQWSWGLDTVHADNATTEDARMQQATVNLFADMGAQPQTLQSNLVLASKSTDTVGPSITVSTPSSGATVPVLKPVTISGTAADNGGGQVASVEVSVDGGKTWQAATGTTTWTFTWTPTTQGNVSVQVRGIDDSVNAGTPANIPLTVGPQQCPCSIWPASAAPGTADSGDASALTLGVKFSVSTPASATGIRFYKGTFNTGTHIGALYNASGQLLASATFSGETATGWQQVNFSSQVPLKANTTYVAAYYAPNGNYSFDGSYFANGGAGLAPVTALQSTTTSQNGVYHYGSGLGFPSSSYNNANYWVDVVVDPSQASTTPPTVTSTTPAANATGVSITSPVSATFSEPIDPSASTFTLTDSSGKSVPGSLSVSGQTATYKVAGQLALGATYTASVQATDLWGNAMTSPVTWSFTTSSTPPAVSCPCSLWTSTTIPGTADASDNNSLELGTRFSSAIAGYITGVRFYKGATNTGTHTGSLWSNTGTLLATGTFTNESASGWQTLTFAGPVAITANTPYVVSYHAPVGEYSVDSGYFAGAYSNYPLTALADGAAGGNGLFNYGSTSAFPNGSYGSSNYWVDPVFTTTAPSQPAAISGAALTAPKTQSGVAVDVAHPVTATFSKPVNPSTLKVTVTSVIGHVGTESAAGSQIAGSVAYDAANRTVQFRPSSPLPANGTYKVTVTATDTTGHNLAPVSWTFTSGATTTQRPLRHLPQPIGADNQATPPIRMPENRRGGPVPTGK